MELQNPLVLIALTFEEFTGIQRTSILEIKV